MRLFMVDYIASVKLHESFNHRCSLCLLWKNAYKMARVSLEMGADHLLS